jgi:1,4-dihydroxy-2-naphthoate octaprenyltransferase
MDIAEHRAPPRPLAWCRAIRPWSFTLSLAPVLVGTSLARLDGYPPSLAIVAAALLASLLIHAGTNLQNDVGDFRRGADGSGRIGPPRATTQGWLSPQEVQAAAVSSFALALVPGAYLVARGGWPILLAGLASIAAGAAYTAGPRPIAYTGLGEAFVVFFFGLVAVGGIYYLHTHRLGVDALLAGTAVGSLAAAVLVVNNLRDLDSDRKIGKKTLAVRRGRDFSCAEYATLLLLPFLLLPALWLNANSGPWLLVPLALLPRAIVLARLVRREPAGPGLNRILAATARLGITFAVLLSIGAGMGIGRGAS